MNVLPSCSAFLLLLFIVINEHYCKLNEAYFIPWISLQPSLDIAGNAFANPALSAICKAVSLCEAQVCIENFILRLLFLTDL